MKNLYQDIVNKLNTISTIGYVGPYTGQESDAASIPDFPGSPCALIDFPYTYYKEASSRVQHGHAMVKVILGFDPSTLDMEALFDLKSEVYYNLQGLHNSSKNYAPITRGGERSETKYAGIYLYEMDFYTTVQDTGVYRKGYVDTNSPTPHVVLDLTVEKADEITE